MTLSKEHVLVAIRLALDVQILKKIAVQLALRGTFIAILAILNVQIQLELTSLLKHV